MKIERMPLKGAALVQAEPFSDHRGQFARFFCEQELDSLLDGRIIRQINFSSNRRRGTLRGLHFQMAPYADLKFVRCLRGASYHVVVDIRPTSASYLHWQARRLTSKQMQMLCVPEGFAHGFQTLYDDTELIYFVTAPYAPRHQGGLRFDDPALGISWPLEVSEISQRDQSHPLLGKVRRKRTVA